MAFVDSPVPAPAPLGWLHSYVHTCRVEYIQSTSRSSAQANTCKSSPQIVHLTHPICLVSMPGLISCNNAGTNDLCYDRHIFSDIHVINAHDGHGEEAA